MHALQLPQWSDAIGLSRQGDVDEDLAEEEHRAGVAVERERVLAAPADAAPRRELDLEHRRRIGEDAMAERADRRGEPVGEQVQAPTQDLVIVAAAGVDRHRRRVGVGEPAPFDRLPAGLGPRRQVVEPGGDDAERSGDELGRAGALHSVRGHVVHLAVKAVVEPCGQPRLGRRQIDSGHADLGKSELASPAAQLREHGRPVDGKRIAHWWTHRF